LSVTFGVIRECVGISIVHIQGIWKLHNLSLVSRILKTATASRWGPTRNIFSYFNFGLFQDIFSVGAIRIFPPKEGTQKIPLHIYVFADHSRVFMIGEYFKYFCTGFYIGWSTQNVGQAHIAIDVAAPLITLMLNELKYIPVCVHSQL
jgi:hypothetical protein